MQQTSPIRYAQRQRDTPEHDGRYPKGNQTIKPREVGKPEALTLQKPHLANKIWNPQVKHQPTH